MPKVRAISLLMDSISGKAPPYLKYATKNRQTARGLATTHFLWFFCPEFLFPLEQHIFCAGAKGVQAFRSTVLSRLEPKARVVSKAGVEVTELHYHWRGSSVVLEAVKPLVLSGACKSVASRAFSSAPNSALATLELSSPAFFSFLFFSNKARINTRAS